MAVISKSITALIGAVMLACAAFGSAVGQETDLRQIQLTEEMVRQFIAAQKDLKLRAQEIESASDDEGKLMTLLEDVAKKAGFASFEEFDVVAANVTLIVAGIDPETRTYTDPKEAIRLEIKEIKGDKSLTDEERQKLTEELEEALASTPDVKHPENVKLVQKMSPEIESVLE